MALAGRKWEFSLVDQRMTPFEPQSPFDADKEVEDRHAESSEFIAGLLDDQVSSTSTTEACRT